MGNPIDRTAKAELDLNLVNGVVSDAPKLKANNDVLYDYVDYLNGQLDQHASASVIPHPDGSVTTVKIANNAITSEKLANNAVVTAKIADNAVTTSKIADQSVTSAKLANGVFTSEKISNNAITTDKIAFGSVTTEKIANGAVTADKLDADVKTNETINNALIRGLEKDFDAYVNENIPFLKNGKLVLPSDFPKLPFNIYKNKYGEWYSDATPYNVFDWSDATHIYIKSTGSSGDGLSYISPITLSRFKTNFTSGVYGSTTKFVLNILDYLYVYGPSTNDITIDFDADVLFRPMNASKFTWFGRMKHSLINNLTSEWVPDSGVYKTTQTSEHDVIDVVNLALLDGDFNMPSIYRKVGSLAECQNEKGTFFSNGYDCYCNPLDGHDIEDIVLVVGTSIIRLNQTYARTIIFENCGFLPSSYSNGVVDNLNATVYFFGCKFHRGYANGLYISGQYHVHSFNCVVSHPTLDAFNYHTFNPESLATEVNCVGYGSGKYKMQSGQPTHSNNGSTAHNGMYMLRVGCRYFETEGPIVADADNCYSISVGCEASNILDSTTGVRAAYYMYDRPEDTIETAKPKFILECKGYGKNVDYGVNGTGKTYVANFIGNLNFVGGVQRSVNPW